MCTLAPPSVSPARAYSAPYAPVITVFCCSIRKSAHCQKPSPANDSEIAASTLSLRSECPTRCSMKPDPCPLDDTAAPEGCPRHNESPDRHMCDSAPARSRSEEHTSELQSLRHPVCR